MVLLNLYCLSHRVIHDSNEGLDSPEGASMGQARQGASMRHFLVTKDTHLVFYGNLHRHVLFTAILSKPGRCLHWSSVNSSLYSKPKTHLGALWSATVRQHRHSTSLQSCKHKPQVTLSAEWLCTMPQLCMAYTLRRIRVYSIVLSSHMHTMLGCLITLTKRIKPLKIT